MPIDLRSDTVTKPTAAMRRAMADAEVGDDERDGDPTTRRLEERVAAMLGKEAALFFPSGGMANQAAVWLFASSGTEVFLDHDAHIYEGELGATATLCAATLHPVVPTDGVMSADDLRRAIRPSSRYNPKPALVCVENTHNGAGGRIVGVRESRAIRQVAAEHGLPLHIDGARLWNASVASGVSLAELADHGDTVMVAFSKGLGAPVGAALAGTRAAMKEAWTARKLFGGAMRQSGILAAGALYALDHHIDRLAEDHENARSLARALDGAGGAVVIPPETNIVMIDLPTGRTTAAVARATADEGVLVSQWTPTRVRLVTHLDVSAHDAARAAGVIARALETRMHESPALA
jgi:threonine aldolase